MLLTPTRYCFDSDSMSYSETLEMDVIEAFKNKVVCLLSTDGKNIYNFSWTLWTKCELTER